MDEYGENPYNNSTIYQIKCNETNEVYIGSTIERMRYRMAHHKGAHSRCSSKQIINRNNYSVTILEKVNCESKAELRESEQYWINKTNNIINEHICVSKSFNKKQEVKPEPKPEPEPEPKLKSKPTIKIVNKVGAIPLEKTEAQIAHRKAYQKKLGEEDRS